MHARIDQLLSLRDGEPVDADVQVHVAACSRCSGSLAGLVRMREQLQKLPGPVSHRDLWPAVQSAMTRQPLEKPRREVRTRAVLAASLVVLALAMLWRLNDPLTDVTTRSAYPQKEADVEHTLAADRLAQLRSQSQALEELLAELPQQSAVERAGTALPIDTIEAQVQWLDHQILASGDEMQPAATEQLWRERVEAMNSLVRLRYVDAQRVAL